jgi:hypothetical protein
VVHGKDRRETWSPWRDRQAQARFRKAVLAKAGNRCEHVNDDGQRCLAVGAKQLQAHHDGPMSTYDPAEGRALCREHHHIADQDKLKRKREGRV